jgi:protein-S-isoprenylcysteine O-methyltransferase Ste14
VSLVFSAIWPFIPCLALWFVALLLAKTAHPRSNSPFIALYVGWLLFCVGLIVFYLEVSP